MKNVEAVEEDEIYFTIQIRRSDVEARFAETGTPAKPRSIEIIGDCLRDTDVFTKNAFKWSILNLLLADIEVASRQKLAEKEAERKEKCQMEGC